MNSFFAQFHVVGEVAETRMSSEPERQLLVDISMKPADKSAPDPLRYPNRISCCITDDELIRQFQFLVQSGDLVEVRGSFDQGRYVAYNSDYVDTTFVMKDFRLMGEAKLRGEQRKHAANPQRAIPFH